MNIKTLKVIIPAATGLPVRAISVVLGERRNRRHCIAYCRASENEVIESYTVASVYKFGASSDLSHSLNNQEDDHE